MEATDQSPISVWPEPATSSRLEPNQPFVCDTRSLFFARPQRLLDKLSQIRGQTLIFDLEDGVPLAQKADRRALVATLLQSGMLQGRRVLLRVNGLDDGVALVEDDLRDCLVPGVHGLILPMLKNDDQVRLYDALVSSIERKRRIADGSIGFYPLLERADGILNAAAIGRASPRVRALCFGHADFLVSLGGEPGDEAVEAAIGPLVLAAGAVGVPAVASPYLDVANTRGFKNYCTRMRRLGFSGAFTLNPQQDRIAVQAFSITALEAQQARAVLDNVRSDAALGVVRGQMVGPPMAARAARLLAHASERSVPPEDPVIGRSRSYGLNLDSVHRGQTLVSPHEVTIDDGWRTMWQASFPTSNRLVTSDRYAQQWGFEQRMLPAGLLLNLTLCLSVEPFSHSCRLHLGLHDAVQLAPAYAGDTFRNFIRVEDLRNTSRGDASVIESTHVLVNQRDECVYRLTKMSYFDPIPRPDAPAAPADPKTDALFSPTGTLDALVAVSQGSTEAPTFAVETGELIVHPAVRPIGWSENLLLTTLVRNTHPVHFDAQRFAPDEMIVCGGFVQSMALAVAESELRQVITERLVHSSHVNTVAPEDRIGAISRILSIEPVSDRLERVWVKTLGLRNVDVERTLVGLPIPSRLFVETNIKPSEVEGICRRERPELEGQIAVQVTRSLLRPRVDRG